MIKKQKNNRNNSAKQFLISIMLVGLVSGICYIISPYFGYRGVALILLVTVSLIAMLFDIFPVLVSALLSALIWNFFFIPPKFTLSIDNTEDFLMFLMYFVIATLNGVLTYKIRIMKKEAQEREEKENVIKLYNTLFNCLSHELQTPISTIIGATDTLKENETKLTDKSKNELVDEISIASLRLNEQVGNLLNISRLESGAVKLKKDWCDINELIYSAVSKLDARSYSQDIKVIVSENIPYFELDFGIMEQVIHNLLKNAIQYTPEMSTITISARFVTSIEGHFEKDNFEIEPHRDLVSTKLIIVVADNGKGFPENEIERVFDKFYRLQNSKTGGTGLGLSIVKGFIESHQGTISLRNIPDDGAEFTIEIPAKTTYLNALKNE